MLATPRSVPICEQGGLAALAQQTLHARNAPHVSHQARQVHAVFYLHREAQLREQLVLVVFHADEGDVGVGFADLGGHKAIVPGKVEESELIDRITAAGTTDTAKLIEAFAGHHFDGGKKTPCYWRACDHQNVQQTYAGEIVPKSKRRSENEFFNIASAVGGEFAAESCSNPDSTKAAAIFASQTIVARSDYAPVTTK